MPDSDSDHWLRAQGLPTLVPLRRWGDDLPRRIAPGVVWLTGLQLLALLALLALSGIGGNDLYSNAALAWLLVGSAALAVLPVLIALWIRRVLARVRRANLVASTMVVAALVVDIALSAALGDYGVLAEFAFGLAGLVLIAVITWSGVGALIAWTLRSAVTNLGAVRHMATIALPVILLLVIFAFFSAEPWQLTDSLSWPRLFGFGLVIWFIGAFVVLPASWRSVMSDDERRPRRPLSGLQQLNVLLVMIISQLLMAAMFATLLTTILVIVGDISVTRTTQRAWVGHRPVDWVVSDQTMPVTVNLLKAAVFLSLVAALSFVISSVSDREYRQHFFDPMLERIAAALHTVDPADGVRTAAGGAASNAAPPGL